MASARSWANVRLSPSALAARARRSNRSSGGGGPVDGQVDAGQLGGAFAVESDGHPPVGDAALVAALGQLRVGFVGPVAQPVPQLA